LYSRTGSVIPRSPVRYINGFHEVDDDNNLVSNSQDLIPSESSVDKLLQSLWDKGFGHYVLYHQRKPGSAPESVMVAVGRLMVLSIRILSPGWKLSVEVGQVGC
jgi:hypothetical protein